MTACRHHKPSSSNVTLCAVSGHLFSPYLSQHGSDKNLLRCAWSPDGEMVTVGSADRAVHVWDVPSTQELYFLPGHKGTVNEVSSKATCMTLGEALRRVY